LNKLDLDDFEAAVGALRAARRIEFYGWGFAIIARMPTTSFFV